MMKIIKRIGIIFLTLIILIIALEFYFYNNLNVKEEPVKSDVIIYLDGGDISRFKETGKLYHEKYADKVIVTQSIETKDYNNVKALEDEGINSKDIIRDPKATSTWTNAVNSVKLMKQNNLKKALVVTNDFHGARTKLAFDRAIGNSDISYRIITTPDKDGKDYKQSEMFKSTVYRELVVLPAYWLGLYNIFDL